MRILQLRFKNLNSLVGEWQIDFSHQNYIDDGIFAIVGPTGAGKTTILDAICLALYGCTPRLGKISANSNEIMSRQCGDCFAEITFAIRNCNYRSHWSQRRAHKNPQGELQKVKHEICCADNGKIIAEKLRDVSDKIEEITGMNFERFSRSMLLAQGAFATFLHANDSERAPILEQITGTQIYSNISIRVHEKKNIELQQLNQLKSAIENIDILSNDEQQQLQLQLQQYLQNANELKNKLNICKEAIAWHEKINNINIEIDNLAKDEINLQNELLEFAADNHKLQRATIAANFEGKLAILITTRNKKREISIKLTNHCHELSLLQTAVANELQNYQNATQDLTVCKQQIAQQLPLWQQVISLDEKLAEQYINLTEYQQQTQQIITTISNWQQQYNIQIEKRNKQQLQLEQITNKLHNNSTFKLLCISENNIDKQIEILQTQQNYFEKNKINHRQISKELKEFTYKQSQLQIKYEQAQNNRQLLIDKLQNNEQQLQQLLSGRNINEYRRQKECLLREMALHNRIAALEKQRELLIAGECCPLCGSKEHPYIDGDIPAINDTEIQITNISKLIEKIENTQALIESIKNDERALSDNLLFLEKDIINSNYHLANNSDSLRAIERQLIKDAAAILDAKRNISQLLIPLATIIDCNTAINYYDLQMEIANKKIIWEELTAQQKNYSQQLNSIDEDINKILIAIDTQQIILKDRQQQLERLQQQCAINAQKRQQLYSNNDPIDEQKKLNANLLIAENLFNNSYKKYQSVQQKSDNLQIAIDFLTKNANEINCELQSLQCEFDKLISNSIFIDEDELQRSLLPSTQRDLLINKKLALDKQQATLESRRFEWQSRLDNEKQRAVTVLELTTLQNDFAINEQYLNELNIQIANINFKLQNNAIANKEFAQQKLIIEAQQREFAIWNKLHDLIGSADGKKYRNFAQGITFSIVIAYANKQLQKMNERYLLLRDINSPLNLNIVDNYQGGEIRSTANLSGGESFIVSLALALGLAQMVSNNVRVDSLFLDEGFGTLDEDSLQNALEALTNLKQEGKLIGVISHVSTLQERIATQIVVTPKNGGISTIKGAGCTFKFCSI